MEKPTLSHQPSSEEIEALRDTAGERNGKAIIGRARFQVFGQEAVNVLYLEGGAEIIETDDGEATSWPDAVEYPAGEGA